jgi:hypothetical protein
MAGDLTADGMDVSYWETENALQSTSSKISVKEILYSARLVWCSDFRMWAVEPSVNLSFAITLIHSQSGEMKTLPITFKSNTLVASNAYLPPTACFLPLSSKPCCSPSYASPHPLVIHTHSHREKQRSKAEEQNHSFMPKGRQRR